MRYYSQHGALLPHLTALEYHMTRHAVELFLHVRVSRISALKHPIAWLQLQRSLRETSARRHGGPRAPILALYPPISTLPAPHLVLSYSRLRFRGCIVMPDCTTAITHGLAGDGAPLRYRGLSVHYVTALGSTYAGLHPTINMFLLLQALIERWTLQMLPLQSDPYHARH